MKKRILNLALALCLVLNLCPASALASSAGNGELCLTMHRTGAVAKTTFALELQGADGSAVKTASLTAAQGESVSAVSIADIPDGTYTLQLQAEGYLPYTQTLTYDSAQQANCIQLDLYNYVSVNEGAGGHGVMPAGDVNGDGVINDADADAVTAAMGTSETRCDLDGSGTVDLVDLTIVVRNQGGCTEAKPVNTISSTRLAQTLTVAATEGTVVSGSPAADLLDQQKTETRVALRPAQSAPISEENPVELTLEPKSDAPADNVPAEAIVIVPPAGAASTITAGEVEIETEDGQFITATIRTDDSHSAAPASLFSLRSAPTPEVTVEGSGTVVINLGRRVAIKKVTIRVTGASQTNLAEIAKVEFLSDFGQRIPEPQLSIPDVLTVTNTESDGLGYKNLTVTWTPQSNVTGYEVSVTGPGYAKTASTSQTSYTFQGDSFNGTVVSFKTYTIKVRSVSGDWKSQWSAPYSHTVTCNQTPPRPQYLTAEAGVNSLKVTWNCKFDAETYTLYYKAVDEETYLTKTSLTTPSCTLTGLRSGVKYTLYVVAHNRNGDSPKSADAEGIPTSASGVELPKYKLINTDDGSGMATTHITSISGNNSKSYTIHKADGTTVANTAATPEDWKALLDGQPSTYLTITDWDSGVTYGNFRGPILQLDDRYTLDTIRMTPFEGSGVHMNAVKVGYRDETGAIQTMNASFYTRYDSQNRRYYEVILDQPITTDYLEIRTSTSYGATQNYTICEVRLYYYDDLENTVAALFKDDARTELQPEVTLEQLEALITRTEETTDPVSGEHHPHKATILSDLEYAKGLLEHTATAAFVTVNNQVTAKGSPANGFAQTLSDYQPLGCVAAAGDVVVIYVIDKDGKTAKGSNVELKLVATQYHPQVRAWQSSAIQLKAGRNEITIPKIGSDATERGGSLYLQYTGAQGARNYEVRTTGATQIPTLRLDGVTGAERTAAIAAYVSELQAYATQIETLHTQLHGTDKENVSVQYAYDAKNCFLNATELTMENMMYSLPAIQVWSALSATGDPAGSLENSIAAMEQELTYFYQFKGLHPDAEGADAYPYTRLNIRYHQMFTGAFMYAGGKHIGIEYGSAGELMNLTPVTTDADGKKTGGKLSGWGIAHEIGHCINAASYQRVEVTNNVFAQLAKTDETNATFRTTYNKVYKAVATGTTGHTGDLAVQLAMYWQLHLAYDNDYTFKLYDTIEAQQAGLFYARLESYLRTPSKAPKAFTATSGDQLFMQAACAAANKDLLDFFRAWGIYPSAATEAYAAQYPKELRKLQYIDDDSRLYRLQGGAGMAAGTAVQATITNATDSRINGNRVEFTLSHDGDAADMLGYEISRNGKMVAFVPVTETSYTDIVTTENNKAFTYTVIGIDKLLNKTAPVQLPEVKVCHDGAISKDTWTATTNMTSPKDTTVNKDNDDPDAGLTATEDKVSAITAALDNDPNTVYYGASSGSGNRPWVVLDLGGVEQVTALKFTPAPEGYTGDASNGTPAAGDLYKYRLFGYKIEVSTDGETWTTVKEGNAYTGSAADPISWKKQDDVIEKDGSYILYFNKQSADGGLDPFMYTYDAAYVRLTSTTMSAMAVAELDVLGPTSDNVELLPEGFGRLAEDFTSSDETIPAGSILFYGSYKGDPSYNVVLLQDQDGNTINGDQLIFAEVPAKGSLGETSDGRWFYWLEDEAQLTDLQTVQAQLYRVQDAHTMAGQRLTSTSLTMTVPSTIPEIKVTAEPNTRAYQPTETMTKAAQALAEAPQPAAQALSALPGGLYADTGSAETTEDPIHLSASKNSVTYQVKPADEVALAVQTGFTLTPAVSTLQTTPAQVEGLYQSSRYANGTLELYAVARSGSIGSVTLTGTLTGADKTCTVEARSLSWLDSVLGPIHAYNQGGGAGEGPAITASAQLTAAGGSSGGNTGDNTGDNTGSGGSSSKPSTGSGTVTGAQATVAATVRNNTATATLSTQAATKLVTNTAKGGEAVVKVDAPTSATQTTLTLPSSLAADLAADRSASLTVDTPLAQVSLPTAALTQLGKSAKSIAVSVESQNGLHTLTITQDGSTLTTLPGGVKVRLTAPDKAGMVAVLVNKDGTETILKKPVVTQGAIWVPLTGSATIKLVDNSKTFQDAQTHWAKSSIDFVSSRNLFQGTGANQFSPESSMSRGMLVTVLHRLEDEPSATGGQPFSDVPAGKWYAQGVAWASGSGIVTGEGDGIFAPDRSITRQEMAVMLYRYATKVGMDTTAKKDSLTTYQDSGAVSTWATEAMNWAVSQGLIGGMGAGRLAPQAPATRAQVATILERLIKLM